MEFSAVVLSSSSIKQKTRPPVATEEVANIWVVVVVLSERRQGNGWAGWGVGDVGGRPGLGWGMGGISVGVYFSVVTVMVANCSLRPSTRFRYSRKLGRVVTCMNI